jgi:hypothetical protein
VARSAYIASETKRWRTVIEAANIKMNRDPNKGSGGPRVRRSLCVSNDSDRCSDLASHCPENCQHCNFILNSLIWRDNFFSRAAIFWS